jgi:hypothetical protein
MSVQVYALRSRWLGQNDCFLGEKGSFWLATRPRRKTHFLGRFVFMPLNLL